MKEAFKTSDESGCHKSQTIKNQIQQYKQKHSNRFRTMSFEDTRTSNLSQKPMTRDPTSQGYRLDQPRSHDHYHEDLLRRNQEKLNEFRAKMGDNSLYNQYFTPACRLINQQRFLSNMVDQQQYNAKGGVGCRVLGVGVRQ